MLVIDDAHWADEPSQHIVQLLVNRLPELPIVLVLTVRNGEHSAGVATTLAAIARSDAAQRMH